MGPDGGSQHFFLVTKDTDGQLHKTSLMGVRYVPLVNRDGLQ